MERRVKDMNMEKTALCVEERRVRKREKRIPQKFFSLNLKVTVSAKELGY